MDNKKQKVLIKIIKYLLIVLIFLFSCWIAFTVLVHYYLIAGYYKADEKLWIKNIFETSQANIYFKIPLYKINFISGHHRIEFEILIKNQTNSPLCFYPQNIKIIKRTKDKKIISKELIYQDKFFIYPSKHHIWSSGSTVSSGRVFIEPYKIREIYVFIDSNQENYKRIHYLDTEVFQEPIFTIVDNKNSCEPNLEKLIKEDN